MRKLSTVLFLIVGLLAFPHGDPAASDRFVDAIEEYAQGDYPAALHQLNTLAEKGDVRAICWLGFMYQKGEGIEKNLAEAAKWYRVAAEQGYASAQEDLGGLCARGAGVPRDYVEAYLWLDLAATRFSGPATGEEAARKRDSIASKLSPAELAEVQRQVREWRPKKER